MRDGSFLREKHPHRPSLGFSVEPKGAMHRAGELVSPKDGLQRRYLPFIHARSTGINRAIGRALRRLIHEHNGSSGRVHSFVLRQAIRLVTHLHDLSFQFAFFLGQKVLVLNERRVAFLEGQACVLNIKKSLDQGGLGLTDFDGVPGIDRDFRHIDSGTQPSNGA